MVYTVIQSYYKENHEDYFDYCNNRESCLVVFAYLISDCDIARLFQAQDCPLQLCNCLSLDLPEGLK
jgi:hypothetical protein